MAFSLEAMRRTPFADFKQTLPKVTFHFALDFIGATSLVKTMQSALHFNFAFHFAFAKIKTDGATQSYLKSAMCKAQSCKVEWCNRPLFSIKFPVR